MLKTWLVACSLFPLFNGWVHLENVTIHHGNVSYFDESKIAAADPLVMLFLTHTVYFRVDFNDKKVRAQLEDIFREFARRHRKSNVRKPFVQAIGNTQNGGYLVFDPTERAPKTYKSWENITYSDYVPTTIKHYCVSHLELVQTSRITMDCVYSEEQIHIYYPNNKTGKSTISQELLTQEDYNFYTDNHLHTTCYQTMKTKPGKVHMRTICKCHGYYECLEVHRTRKCFVGEIRTKSFDLDKGEGVMDINETIYGHPDIRMPRSAANGCGLYFILSVDDRNAFLRGLFYANHERRRDIMNMSLHDPVFANAFRKQYRIEFPPHHIEKTLFALNYFLDNYTITKEVRIQKDRYYQNYCLFHLMNEGDEQKCVVAIEVGPERFWDNFAIPNVSITELLNSTDYKLKTSGQIGQYFIQWKTYKNTGKSFFVFECKGRRCHDILIKNHAKSSHYITNRTCSSGSRSYTLAELQSPITDFPRVISRFNLCFRAAYKTHEAVSRTYFPLDTDGNYFLVHKAKRFKHPIYRKGIFHSIINMLYQLHTTIKITGRHRDNTRYDTVIETFNGESADCTLRKKLPADRTVQPDF
uniref:Uncharacterized protein n=1 Tax=Bursaphelenchus xylophilus TaxID=6326 RepID=A0A1I7SX85_BURXY